MDNELETKQETPKGPSYESTHELKRLMFTLVVVNEGLSSTIVKMLYEHEAALAFIVRGHGTSKNDFHDVMGMGESNKDVVISIIDEKQWPPIKEEFGKRFNISPSSKGIAYTVPLDSIVGVSIYKMLANIKQFENPKTIERKRKRERKNGK